MNEFLLNQYILTFTTRDGGITAVLDQKHYVEELNRHLRWDFHLFSYTTLVLFSFSSMTLNVSAASLVDFCLILKFSDYFPKILVSFCSPTLLQVHAMWKASVCSSLLF